MYLNAQRRMARGVQRQGDFGLKIEMTGLCGYARSAGYKTGSITYELETKTFSYDRGIKLLADVMGVEEASVRHFQALSLAFCRLALSITRLRFPRLAVILVRRVDKASHALEVFIVVAPT